MRVIYKQELKITDVQVIEVPKYSKILYVNKQHGSVCVWYECDTNFPLENRIIYCFGTGHKMPNDDMKYIGTVITTNDNLVIHFYEKL